MPRHEPFQKWNETPDHNDPAAREGRRPTGETPAVKLWIVRFAWVISTSMLVLGALLIILILAGQGHRIGL